MIVVDSSVWISWLRLEPTDAVRKLDAVADPRTIAVGDLVLFEVLQGARDDRHAAFLAEELGQFEAVRLTDPHLAVMAAKHSRRLRERGITIRRAIDLLIATFCIENGHWLLHQDRDFDPIARHCGLRVL